jgi:hypothetical protein
LEQEMADWPAPGWSVHEVAPTLCLRVTRGMPRLSAGLEAEIDRRWTIAQTRTGGRLFNGRVFSADTMTPELVSGHWTEYRRIVAQMDQVALHRELDLRPMAVGGVLRGPDGVVFGQRPARAVYQAGMWQLPPAGSIDTGAENPDGTIDFARQILTELAEELGMPARMARIVRPLCIVEHAGSHVCDLGVEIETRLTAGEIAACHAHAPDAEYGELRMVPVAELKDFVTAAGERLTPQARVFLARMGLLASESDS